MRRQAFETTITVDRVSCPFVHVGGLSYFSTPQLLAALDEVLGPVPPS